MYYEKHQISEFSKWFVLGKKGEIGVKNQEEGVKYKE